MTAIKLKNLKMRKKISIGLVPVALMAMIVAVDGFLGFIFLNKIDNRLYNNYTKSLSVVSEMMDYTNQMKFEINNAL